MTTDKFYKHGVKVYYENMLFIKTYTRCTNTHIHTFFINTHTFFINKHTLLINKLTVY